MIAQLDYPQIFTKTSFIKADFNSEQIQMSGRILALANKDARKYINPRSCHVYIMVLTYSLVYAGIQLFDLNRF